MKHFFFLRREITVLQLYYVRTDKRSTVFGFVYLLLLNPLSPKSDQHQISPCNSDAL